MRIENTSLNGLKIIYLDKFEDIRGEFIKVFNETFLHENNLVTSFKESYFTMSNKNVIRGMHFQIPPDDHTKIVYINNGSIIDVVLDIRANSESFGKYFSIKLTAENPMALYIPVGFAHGFLSLEDNTILTYLQDSVYNKGSDTGIKWNSFGFDWETSKPIISERDLAFENLSNFNSPF